MSVELESLELQVQSTSEQAAKGIESLIATLNNLKSVTKGGLGLNAVVKQLNTLNTALNSINIDKKKLGTIKSSLDGLSQNKFGNSSLNTTAKQITNIAASINAIDFDDTKIQKLVTSLSGLQSISKPTGATSTLNLLKRIPEITEQLKNSDLDEFAKQIQLATNALKPLATEMEKVSRGFAAFPIRIQKIIASNGALSTSNTKTAKTFNLMGVNLNGFYGKITLWGFALSQVSNIVSNWVESSNAYVENMNLFNVAMGDAAQSAYDYAQTVKEALGIDPSDWMRNQGVFKQIVSGFGVAEEKANLMSQNLTQLGYDISSFFNITVSEAMEKVQSGISGELEPLRRLGYALDVATLQEIAYANGINKSINSMTQAEKSQLRYLAIYQQSKNVMGDMARTVQTPANAMRILQQQTQQLARALGNVLIPILQKIIPVVQAVVEILTEWIQILATLFHFELPTIDYSGLGSGLSGVSTGAEDVAGALDDATEAANELKQATLGIDELNILPDTSSAGGAGGAGGGAGGDALAGLDLPSYDFLGEIQQQTDELKKKLKPLLAIVLAIGAAFLAWKIGNDIKNAIGFLSAALAPLANWLLPKIAGALAGLAIQFGAAGGGVKGFLSALGLLTTTVGPVIVVIALLAAAIKVLIERWDDIKAAFAKGLEDIGLGESLEELKKKVLDLANKLGINAENWEQLKDAMNNVVDFIGGTVITIIGSSLIGVINAAITVMNGFITIVTGVVDVLQGLATFLKGVFLGDVELSAQGLQQIFTGIGEIILGFFTTVSGSLVSFIQGVLSGLGNLGGTLLGNVGTFLNNMWATVQPWFTVDKWLNLFSNIGEAIKSAVKSGVNAAVGVLNNFISWLNNKLQVTIPSISILGQQITSAKTFKLFSIPTIPQFEMGGFPEMGQLFLASEAGPELVGQFGSRTAVVNNDQIITGIREGVYEAVVAAMKTKKDGGNDTPIFRIYLDGKDITTSQNNRNRMYGKTLQSV